MRDARECERLDTSPPTLYQLACVFALTSRLEPDDRKEGLRLLTRALRGGYSRFDVIDTDRDVDLLRKFPEFQRLVSAARELQR